MFGSVPACAGNSHTPSSHSIRSAVHPRVCGELDGGVVWTSSSVGSSPRVRGTPGIEDRPAKTDRFIPACAGNSRSTTHPTWPRTVHPRVCGELRYDEGILKSKHGSSPRVRGTQRQSGRQVRDVRFIPACAGNSTTVWDCAWPSAVHPRVCGELDGGVVWTSSSVGSSPRVRGTPARCAGSRRRARFIPACAGNSKRQKSVLEPGTVHPRVCGELSNAAAMRLPSAGSSPRVRGTPGKTPAAPSMLRFIPACAGNSTTRASRPTLATVHPRVCGELGPRHVAYVAHFGSSPRVRGTHTGAHAVNGFCRFIPACAGNSRRSVPRSRGRPVHPRVCGELQVLIKVWHGVNGSSPRVRGTPCCLTSSPGRLTVHPRVCGELAATLIETPQGNGSSPRVRGTPEERTTQQLVHRFIPACAGNSPACPTAAGCCSVHPRVCGELPA